MGDKYRASISGGNPWLKSNCDLRTKSTDYSKCCKDTLLLDQSHCAKELGMYTRFDCRPTLPSSSSRYLNGSHMNRRAIDYTNVPICNTFIRMSANDSRIVYNVPNAPEYGQKGTDNYDPVRYNYGSPYTF